VPYMLVIGEKEVNENKLAVRKQGEGDMGTKTIEEFIEIIVKEKPNKY